MSTDADAGQAPIGWRRHERLVDEVATEVRRRIYEGHYFPGAVIRQESLSAELGISRTPLREAIRMLEREGLIVAEPGRGARVVTGDRATLLAAYELRAVVDGLAARLAANLAHFDTKGLRRIVKEQQEALDPWVPSDYTALNVEFHETIIRATANEFVIAQIPLLRMTAQIFTPVKVVDQSAATNAVRQHRTILGAIKARDPVRSESLARDHINTTIRRIRALEPTPGTDTRPSRESRSSPPAGR